MSKNDISVSVYSAVTELGPKAPFNIIAELIIQEVMSGITLAKVSPNASMQQEVVTYAFHKCMESIHKKSKDRILAKLLTDPIIGQRVEDIVAYTVETNEGHPAVSVYEGPDVLLECSTRKGSMRMDKHKLMNALIAEGYTERKAEKLLVQASKLNAPAKSLTVVRK